MSEIIRRIPIVNPDKQEKHTVKSAMALQLPSDKLSVELFALSEETYKRMKDGKKRTVNESEQSKEAKTRFWLEVVKGCELQTSERLTDDDLHILAACMAEQSIGNRVSTAGIIWRNMGGNGDPSPKTVEKILQSIDKMMGLKIRIDATDTTEKLQQIKDDQFKEIVVGTILPCEYRVFTLNGIPNTLGVVFYAVSPVFRYALAKKQITFIPSDLLVIEGTKNTTLFRAIKIYITKHIFHIAKTRRTQRRKGKSKKLFATTMLLDTLYKKCGILESVENDRKKRKQVRDYITLYMKALVAKGILKEFRYIDKTNNKCKDIKGCVKIAFTYDETTVESILTAIPKLPIL